MLGKLFQLNILAIKNIEFLLTLYIAEQEKSKTKKYFKYKLTILRVTMIGTIELFLSHLQYP